MLKCGTPKGDCLNFQRVTKEVDVSSREAQEEIKKQQTSTEEAKSSTPTTSEKPSGLSGM